MTTPDTTAAAGGGSVPGRPAPGECGHWDGPNSRYCRAVDSVRRYVQGRRCPLHAPGAPQSHPETQPGPGGPAHRTAKEAR